MMKCNKCGATLLMEQIPEVHISEARVPCNQPGCDGMCSYINNKSPLREVVAGGDPLENPTVSSVSLMEDDTDG